MIPLYLSDSIETESKIKKITPVDWQPFNRSYFDSDDDWSSDPGSYYDLSKSGSDIRYFAQSFEFTLPSRVDNIYLSYKNRSNGIDDGTIYITSDDAINDVPDLTGKVSEELAIDGDNSTCDAVKCYKKHIFSGSIELNVNEKYWIVVDWAEDTTDNFIDFYHTGDSDSTEESEVMIYVYVLGFPYFINPSPHYHGFLILEGTEEYAYPLPPSPEPKNSFGGLKSSAFMIAGLGLAVITLFLPLWLIQILVVKLGWENSDLVKPLFIFTKNKKGQKK
jgi:hypothetical protein